MVNLKNIRAHTNQLKEIQDTSYHFNFEACKMPPSFPQFYTRPLCQEEGKHAMVKMIFPLSPIVSGHYL